MMTRTSNATAILVFLGLLAGCSEEQPRTEGGGTKLAGRLPYYSGEARPSSTTIGPNLPGPPGSAPVPTSTDPEVREVEDRLFKTDGGRVVLKAIRSQGGWRRWLEAARIRATFRDVPAAAPPADSAAAPAAPAPASPGAEVALVPADPPGVPERGDTRLLIGPFWMADPSLTLDYTGVVVDAADGETYDLVDVFREEPGSSFCTAFFLRRTGVLARVLEPPAAGSSLGAGPGFRRIDLLDHREIGGLRLAARWNVFDLPDRFARIDPAKPDRVRSLEVAVDPKPEDPAPAEAEAP